MSNDEQFLRSLLSNPDNAAVRADYARWLDSQGDPRAEFVRFDTDFERPSFVKGLGNSTDHYLEKFPEIRPAWEKWQSRAELRERLRELAGGFDPAWTAFMTSLAHPFQPLLFWNNSQPRSFRGPELPFTEQIGTRGWVVTFETNFRDERSWDAGLMEDLRLLRGIQEATCERGAAVCPVHPFVCESTAGGRLLTAAEVLESLKARHFQSSYIETLDATEIPFPGYHPNDFETAIENDEIHTEFGGQRIFTKPEDRDEEADSQPSIENYQLLKQYVLGGQLWYVLLHPTPEEDEDGFLDCHHVVLLAVGPSPHGNRLVGVVTHQVCHNLCD